MPAGRSSESDGVSLVKSADAIFNFAQCLECMGDVEEALAVVLPLAERLLPSSEQGTKKAVVGHTTSLPVAGDSARLADHVMVLLYIKLRFVAGQTSTEIAQMSWDARRPRQQAEGAAGVPSPMTRRGGNKKNKGKKQSSGGTSGPVRVSSWGHLLSVVDGWSQQVEFAIRRKMPTHWAYGFFVRQLQRLHGSPSGIPSDPASVLTRHRQLKKDASKEQASVYRLLGARSPWIPIVGDSHCLSLAWTRLVVAKSAGARGGGSLKKERVVTESPVVVPFVVTGLQAWHMQNGYDFVTSANLDCVLGRVVEESRCCARYRTMEQREKAQKKAGRSLMSGFLGEETVVAVHGGQEEGKGGGRGGGGGGNGDGRGGGGAGSGGGRPLITCLFCVGEIDCRQGIVGALKKGEYGGDEHAAVKATVRSMVEGLVARAQKFGVRFLVLPVAPPAAVGRGGGGQGGEGTLSEGGNEKKTEHARLVAAFNKELKAVLLDEDVGGSAELLDWRVLAGIRGEEQQLFSPSTFDADGTHLNRKIVPLVAQAYWSLKGS